MEETGHIKLKKDWNCCCVIVWQTYIDTYIQSIIFFVPFVSPQFLHFCLCCMCEMCVFVWLLSFFHGYFSAKLKFSLVVCEKVALPYRADARLLCLSFSSYWYAGNCSYLASLWWCCYWGESTYSTTIVSLIKERNKNKKVWIKLNKNTTITPWVIFFFSWFFKQRYNEWYDTWEWQKTRQVHWLACPSLIVDNVCTVWISSELSFY